jgi:trigger factor
LDLEAKTTNEVWSADAKLIDGQVERIQKQFGTAVPQEEVVAGADLTGTFTNEKELTTQNLFGYFQRQSDC